MNEDLTNKVIVVIGALGLLGKSITVSLLDKGAKVVLADINVNSLNEFKEDLLSSRDSNIDIVTTQVDITDIKSVENLIRSVTNQNEKIAGVVNSAYPRNSNYGLKFEDVQYNDFCENLNLHLGGYFLVSQMFAKHFVKNGGGSIVNIASIYGVIPPKFEVYEDTEMTMPVEYAVIKSGLVHLDKYIAKYYRGKNIRINTVSPGGIFNHQPPSFVEKYNKMCNNIGMLEPVNVARIVAFLFSDSAVGLHGQNIIIDDGFTL